MVSVKRLDELEFSADPGITGFEMAHLTDNAAGSVKFWKIPRGWNIGQLGVSENLHVHRTVFEYAAILSGQLPHIEYDLERGERTQIVFSPGQLMIRPCGSIHGLNDTLTVERACLLLYWNTGIGTSLLDATYPSETADLLHGQIEEGFSHDGVCRVLDVLGRGILMSRWQVFSHAGEPMRVSLRAQAVGERLPVDELLPASAVFSFLWAGDCRLMGHDGGESRSLPEWTSLLPDAEAAGAESVVANAPSVWLQVEAQPTT